MEPAANSWPCVWPLALWPSGARSAQTELASGPHTVAGSALALVSLRLGAATRGRRCFSFARAWPPLDTGGELWASCG